MHSGWGGGITALLLYPCSSDSHRASSGVCSDKLVALGVLDVMPAGQARTVLGCIISPTPWSGDALWEEINGGHCLLEAQMTVGGVGGSGSPGSILSWRHACCLHLPLHLPRTPLPKVLPLPGDISSTPPPWLSYIPSWAMTHTRSRPRCATLFSPTPKRPNILPILH